MVMRFSLSTENTIHTAEPHKRSIKEVKAMKNIWQFTIQTSNDKEHEKLRRRWTNTEKY